MLPASKPRPAGDRPGRSFLDTLRAGALTADGAMGTQLLGARGLRLGVNLEEIVVSCPEVVERIHEEYLAAGAQVIETDSFGANRFRLAADGLEDRARVINRGAAAIARRVAGDRAWVAGAMGPTGLGFEGVTRATRDAVRDAFREQAAALAEGGADVILIETMRWPDEVDLAVEGARSAVGDEVPVVAQVAIGEDLTMADGTPLGAMGHRLPAIGCDVIGVNCCDGALTARAVEALRRLDVPLSAMPSAGLPRTVEGRLVYDLSPERFGAVADRLFRLGVRLVGGCCGTTPDHVRRIAAVAVS
jgi:homocysteine S-methyltransferase